jgi:pimeloyl-ACP methyl ester carboxylesterase
MGAHNVLVYASRDSKSLRAMVAIDTPPDYSRFAVEFLSTYAVKPPRRFESMEAAVRSFKVMPRETLAKKETLEHIAHHTYRRLEDGSWTHKLDRRTLSREPVQVSDQLSQISCPALIVKVTKSPVLEINAARRMVATLPKGNFEQIDDSFHHVMLDNPEALIAALKKFTATLP